MRILLAPVVLTLAILTLTTCGSPSDESVGGVSRSEAEALNDAAEMLDANTVVPVTVENISENGNGAE